MMESPPSPTARGLRQIPVVCPGHSRPIAELQYSPVTPDGFFLISACHDKLPMLRRGDTGDWIGTFDGHKGAVWSAKVDASAQYAATGSADFSVKLWDALSGDCLTTFEHKHIVKSVEFSLDGTKLYTAGHEKLLRVFDVLAIKEQLESYRSEGRTGIVIPSTAPITCMTTRDQIRKVVAINGQWVATGEVNGTITIWDVETSEKIHELKVDSGVMDMEASRNGTILTVAAGNKVYFYTVGHDWALLHAYTMPMSFSEEGGASLHPTLTLFIAGGSDTWVRVFDYTNGSMVETHKGHHGPVRCLRYAPNGDSFATGSEDGTIRIWQSDMTSKAATAVSAVHE